MPLVTDSRLPGIFTLPLTLLPWFTAVPPEEAEDAMFVLVFALCVPERSMASSEGEADDPPIVAEVGDGK